jgi:RHS repeat-associated protein
MFLGLTRRIVARPRGVLRALGPVAMTAVMLTTSLPAGSAIVLAAQAPTNAVSPATVLNTIPNVVGRPVVPIAPTSGGGGLVPNGGVHLRPDRISQKAPKTRVEVPTQRSANGRVFANPDGTFTAEINAGRVNYKDPNGAWQPIDTTLVPELVDGYSLHTKANDIVVRVDTTNADTALAMLTAAGRTLKLRALGFGAGTIHAGRVVATGAPTDGSVEIAPTPEGFEFSVVLPDANRSPTYGFALDIGNLSARLGSDRQTIILVDASGAEVGRVTAPTVFDAAGNTPTGQAQVALGTIPKTAHAANTNSIGNTAPITQAPSIPTRSPAPTADPSAGPSLSGSSAQSAAPTVSADPSASAGPSQSASSAASASLPPSPSSTPSTSSTPSEIPAPSAGPSPSADPSPSPSGSTDPAPSDGIVVPVSPDPSAAPSVSDELAGASMAAPSDTVTPGLQELLVTYSIDAAWLHDPSRTFPVTLDPFVCEQLNNTNCAQMNGQYSDAFVESGNPSTVLSGGTYRIGRDSTDGTALSRMFTFFPTVALVDGAQITDATLGLYQPFGYDNQTLHAAPVTASWPAGVTYNNQPAVDTASWTPSVPVLTSAGTLNLDATTIVRGWFTRRPADWKANLGFGLRLVDESTPCTVSTQACWRIFVLSGSTATITQRPKLTITYVVPNVDIDFAPELGPNFAPSTMVAGQPASLPISVTNNDGVVSFTQCQAPLNSTSDCFRAGYRWLSATGALAGSDVADLPGTLNTGQSSVFTLPVTPPTSPGQYTLRLDLVHDYKGTRLWSSDWAKPSRYYSRNKKVLTSDNTRWTGNSVIERDEFPVAVVAGGGTGIGETKSVDLPDGTSVGINAWSRNLSVEGSSGVGFADLGGSVGVDYYYNSADRNDCTGILAACGWGTNFDEGFTPSSAGADYVYRDASGNRYFVNANASGQLTSGAPVRIERPRNTLFDDNNLTGWSGTPPTVAGSGVTSPRVGANSLAIAVTNLGTSTSVFNPINLALFPTVSFSVKAPNASSAAIAFSVRDSNGVTDWFAYTLGTDFTVPGITKKVYLNTGPLGSWVDTTSRYLYADVRTAFGGYDDDYTILAVKLIGAGGTGSVYYDDLRFEGYVSGFLSEAMPAWTANGAAVTTVTGTEAYSGTSFKVAPTTYANSAACAGCQNNGLWVDAYVQWSWKKVGGTTMAIAFDLTDTRTLATGTITYYAGPSAPVGAPNPIQIASAGPDQWTTVVRNLEEDGRQVLGFYNDADTTGSTTVPSGGPTPDPVKLTGYRLIDTDGLYGLFDAAQIQSLTDTGDARGQLTGDDFTVVASGGTKHGFNRDGHLTSIRDLDGNTTTLVWAYDGVGLTSSLDLIRAASDGLALPGGTAQREIDVTTGSSTIQFAEQLGASGSAVGRYTEFQRTGLDLTAVIPARRSAACGGSGAGCLTFDYTGTHYLFHIYDPRYNGSNNFYTTIGYAGADPVSVTAAATGGVLLRIVNFDADTGWRLRTEWQDADGTATGSNGYARYDDLSPSGSVVTEWAPVACTASNCGSAPAPTSRLVDYTTDGINNYSSETHYRLTGNGAPYTTRRGTYAAAKVDNYSDPLTAGLTAWTQSAEQNAASVAGGNVDLYRSSYQYNPLGLQTHALTPVTNPTGGTISEDRITVYDVEGHVIQQADNGFVANGGFESGVVPAGWSQWTGTSSLDAVNPHGGVYSARLDDTPTGSQITSSFTLPPGQTFHIQFSGRAVTGSGWVAVGYFDAATNAYHAVPGGSWTVSAAGWTTLAADVTVPLDGNGLVHIDLGTNAGNVANFDDVSVFTDYSSATYLATGLMDTETDAFAHVTKADYTPPLGATYPAIFQTSSTANFVSGGTAPDQNAVVTRAFDAWGRALTETDPDGVRATTTYAANMTDVASTADGLGNTTTNSNVDALGNIGTVADPISRATTTTYSFLGDPVDETGPDGVITHHVYDGVGRETDTYDNWTNGGSGVSGVANVRETRTYDQFGNVTRDVSDAGGGLGTSDATGDTTADLLGQTTSSTVYPSGTSGGRLTEAHFDAAGVPAGARGPIPPTATSAPLCPDSGTSRCNTVASLDMNGRAIATTDAYGIVATTWYDLAGHPVQSVANYVAGQSATADRNVKTATVYDLDDRVIGVIDPLGRATSTTYDSLGRIIKISRNDGSWLRTDWTKAGRKDAESRAGVANQGDATVAWTKYLYDAAGRLTTDLANYDRSGAAGLTVDGFESGTDGWSTAPDTWFIGGPAASISTDGAAPLSGSADLKIITAGQYTGVGFTLPGLYLDTPTQHHYRLKAQVLAPASLRVDAFLGESYWGSADMASQTITGNGAWQPIDVAWNPTVDTSTNVRIAFRQADAGSGFTVLVDNVMVYDQDNVDRNIPTETVYDGAGQVIRSVLPPGKAGDAAPVTASTYDLAGRLTDVTVNAVANGGSTLDLNLATHYAYDAIGDRTSSTDPVGVVTRYDYDRSGNVIATTNNYTGGASTASQDVTSKFAYDDLGELTATCPALAVQGHACDPVTAASYAWKYGYDAAGHQVTQTPPTNTSSLSTLVSEYDTASGGARMTRTCDVSSGIACSGAPVLRYTDVAYDNVGRTLSTTTSTGDPNGSNIPKFRYVNGYDADGERTTLDEYDNGSGTRSDWFTFGFDAVGHQTSVAEQGATVTTATYNPDDTVSTRTDAAIGATPSTFTYNARGELTQATSPVFSGTATYGWRLDGLVDTRTWPTNSASGAFSYDNAKRPIGLSLTVGGPITLATSGRTYNRTGSVASETQTLSNVAGPAGSGTQTFSYDALGRVTGSTLGSETRGYTYDADSNRLTETKNGTTSTFGFDSTDQLKTLAIGGGPASNFAYDPYGNLTSSVESAAPPPDTAAPSLPTGLSATAQGPTRINLSWSASSDNTAVTLYRIYRDGTLVMNVSGSATAWSDFSLNPGTLYSYTVSAIDGAGNASAQTTAQSATTASGGPDTTAPTVPSGLSATAVGSSRINLSWTASTDAVGVTSYTIRRGGTVLSQVSGSTISFSDLSAAPSTLYSYTVSAADAAGNSSAQSSSASATTGAAGGGTTYATDTFTRTVNPGWGTADVGGAWTNSTPTNPSDITTNGTSGVVSLPSVTSYYTRLPASVADQEGTVRVKVSSLTGSGSVGYARIEPRFNAALANYYRFQTQFGASGTVDMSLRRIAGGVVTTFRTDTAVVTGLTAGSYVWVKWSLVTSGADVVLKYKLWKDGTTEPASWSTAYTDVAPGSAFTGAGTLQIYSQVLAGFTGTFPFVMTYDDLSITSPGGGGGADTTAPTVPSGLSAAANGPNRVDLAWTASTDAVGVQGYRIYRGGTLIATTASTTFANTGLTASTLYSYTVSAIDGAGNASAQTSAVLATTASGGSDTTAPSIPTAVSATAMSASRIDVSWAPSTDNVGVQGYRIYRDGSLAATIGSSQWFDTGLTSGTPHSYTVAAIDGAGNASAQSSTASATTQNPPLRTTAYAYDVLDRLTTESPAGGAQSSFAIDALGRHTTRTTPGSPTETYTYAGTTSSVVRIATSGGATNAAIDALGSRLAVSSGGTFGWTLPDLHGDIAGYANVGLTAVTDAFRYDPYGELLASVTSTTPSPWRYQGKLLENSGAGTSELYDFGFRSYAPGLAAFTSLDDVSGSAQNPLTLNRFLYAQANPETLIDPDGHAACAGWNEDCVHLQKSVLVHEVIRHRAVLQSRKIAYRITERDGEARVLRHRGETNNQVASARRARQADDRESRTIAAAGTRRIGSGGCLQYGGPACLSKEQYAHQRATFGETCQTNSSSWNCTASGGPSPRCTSSSCSHDATRPNPDSAAELLSRSLDERSKILATRAGFHVDMSKIRDGADGSGALYQYSKWESSSSRLFGGAAKALGTLGLGLMTVDAYAKEMENGARKGRSVPERLLRGSLRATSNVVGAFLGGAAGAAGGFAAGEVAFPPGGGAPGAVVGGFAGAGLGAASFDSLFVNAFGE